MKKLSDKRLVKLYLWLGLCFFVLGTFYTLHIYPDKFFLSMFNNLWNVVYLIPLNFIFFEYTIPFILRKRKTIIYNILPGILLLWVHMMLWSYGSYAWRQLGIQLHTYTELKVFPELDLLLQNRMAFSTGSVFFLESSGIFIII